MNLPRKTTRSPLLLSLTVASAFVSLTSAQAATYSATVLSNNPVAYYRLEEIDGAATAVDSSTNAFDATYTTDPDTNGVTIWPRQGLPGIETNSALFRTYVDSSAVRHKSFVSIPFHPELSPTTGDGQHGAPFSVDFWAKPLTQPSDYSVPLAMFGQYEAPPYGNASGWNFYQTPGPASYWTFNAKNGAFAQADSVPIQPNQWYHLAATFDGSTFVFYVNGVARVTAGGFTTYLANHNFAGQIGAGDNTGFLPFTGGVDEVAFYTNVLSAADVLLHYQVGSTSFSARAASPQIIEDPTSFTATSGSTAKFTVVTDGAGPLSFQWLRNGTPIANATNNPYSFTASFPADDAADFSVVITNSFGSVTSAVATLTVVGVLNVDHQPFSITREAGTNSYAAFRVAASGSIPIVYQWYKVAGGVTNIIAGATNDTLWVYGLKLTDDGSSYFAHVTNAFVVLDTEPATLTVIPRNVEVPITGYAKVIVADKPVAYWRLDEPDASPTAVDIVGSFSGLYGPSAGFPDPLFTYQVPGAVPNSTNPAVKLDGGGVVTVPYALELNPVTGPWSFEAWLKPASPDGGNYRTPFASMWNSDFGNHIFGWNVYQHPEGYWTFNAFNGGAGGSFASEFNDHPLETNKWYHMVITDDLITMRFYVNNVLGASFSRNGFGFIANGINGDVAVAGAPMVFGRRSDSAFDPFPGTIDEVAVYNYALSTAQIRNHYLNTTELTLTKQGNNVVLTWPVGTLQAAPTVTGVYTNVTGATSPYTNAATATQTFFRISLN